MTGHIELLHALGHMLAGEATAGGNNVFVSVVLCRVTVQQG